MSDTTASPILNKLGTVFIPVTDIERARDWYCDLLGIDREACGIMNGHLCALSMQGNAGIILDTMPMWGGREPGGAPRLRVPAVMLLTGDLEASYRYCRENGITTVTEIEHDHWFVIQDPDDNMLMICRE